MQKKKKKKKKENKQSYNGTEEQEVVDPDMKLQTRQSNFVLNQTVAYRNIGSKIRKRK